MSRGRAAQTPREIPASGWKDIALRVKDELSRDHVGLIAAGIAFYSLLALVPGLTAALAVAGLLVDPVQLVGQLEVLEGLVPAEAMAIITSQADEIASGQTSELGFAVVFGTALALYSSSKGMKSLMEGLNIAYDEDERRGFVKRTVTTLTLTFFAVVAAIIALAALIAVPAALELFGMDGPIAFLANAALGVALVIAFMLALAILYRFGPSRASPQWRWVSVGAVAACIGWIIASAGFAFYAASFTDYNETFGALGGVIVLLMWFWISAYVVLAGAELNAEMEAQTKKDTTTGEPEPMGERGAVKADKLGEAAQ